MRTLVLGVVVLFCGVGQAADPPPIHTDVEGQPLAANAERLGQALKFLGTPLSEAEEKRLAELVTARDVSQLQRLLDPKVLFVVNINPESRVKVVRGPGEASLQQSGFVPVLVKIVNESTVKKPLKINSPQSGPRYSGAGMQAKNPKADPRDKDRFLQVELFTAPPMTADLSGLKVEYAIALIYSSEAGKREATISFDVGQGNQDLGFRAEVPVLFEVKPAIPVKFEIKDFDGKPSTARLLITDDRGRVYPPQPKRLAPDFFFQRQVYRHDGGTVLLPPGEFLVESGRGPEYHLVQQKIRVEANGPAPTMPIKLVRWIHPEKYGWISGDHHIHSAGCAHYTSPTEGVNPEDMFLHVKGEGLNVGCCLTWGPCYDHQRQFFEAMPHKLSEPFTIIKYDVEVSGFGSQALGHVCLLNLKDQTYPGSAGTKVKGWPTWTTPLMKWAKEQGAVTGYAHSANGLAVQPEQATRRLFVELDRGTKGFITFEDAQAGKLPLPEPFPKLDENQDGRVSEIEIRKGTDRTLSQLPNYNIPQMNGIGAQEICVTSAMGVCDFISAMDTDRIMEWNCWYHIMNCGFPLKASGETDFPCITGSRVGQGRVYVQMGKIDGIDFGAWCKGVQKGQSYISDGYAHALNFSANGVSPGFGEVKLDKPGSVKLKASVAFARHPMLGTANGAKTPDSPTRDVEIVMNGQMVKTVRVPADDKPHELEFDLDVPKSAWVALRHYPQLHTNPVNVIVGGKPIRASADSAKWCIGVIEQLWRVREKDIIAPEREEARATFQKALGIYRKILDESK